jgi:hypothetical protein
LRLAAVALFGVIVVAVVGEGVLLRQMLPSTPAELGAALSSQSVTRQASLERACPAGSRALVWGWAPELYIEYSWSNTVPFMNTLAISSDPTSRAAGIAIVRKGLADSDCVVDAVGAPFFGVGPESSLPLVCPEFATSLKDDFRVAKNAVQCSSCTVYVRR